MTSTNQHAFIQTPTSTYMIHSGRTSRCGCRVKVHVVVVVLPKSPFLPHVNRYPLPPPLCCCFHKCNTNLVLSKGFVVVVSELLVQLQLEMSLLLLFCECFPCKLAKGVHLAKSVRERESSELSESSVRAVARTEKRKPFGWLPSTTHE